MVYSKNNEQLLTQLSQDLSENDKLLEQESQGPCEKTSYWRKIRMLSAKMTSSRHKIGIV